MANLDENIANERAIAKKIALEDVKTWLAKMPSEERNKPTIIVGSKTFTPNQLLEEVDKESEYGKALQQKLHRLRMEVSKKEA
jgi:hypothetical protein